MGGCLPSVCPAPSFWSHDSQTGDGNRLWLHRLQFPGNIELGLAGGCSSKTLSLNWHGEDLEHVWRHRKSWSSERKCMDGQKQRGKSGEYHPDS